MGNTNVQWPGWDIVRAIGSGSFGTVYEIRRDLFGKVEKAALKVISIPQSRDEIDELLSDGYDEASITQWYKGHLEDIFREYSMMAEMKGHTNIVYCDDFRYIPHDDGFGWDIYIKMELLTPLNKYLSPTIPQEDVLRVGIDMCRALELCKKRSIVHRDIKPQNIFVSKDGDFKLGDFGIAKTTERTSGGTKIGTYKYMAPEVYNNQPYGLQTDIYSLGLVLYWMLNERRGPFLPLPPQVPSHTQLQEADIRRFRGEPLPLPANGCQELKQIVLKACAHSPEERYLSATEMLSDLLDLQAKLGVSPEKDRESGVPEQGEAVLSIDGEVGMHEDPTEPTLIDSWNESTIVQADPEAGTVLDTNPEEGTVLDDEHQKFTPPELPEEDLSEIWTEESEKENPAELWQKGSDLGQGSDKEKPEIPEPRIMDEKEAKGYLPNPQNVVEIPYGVTAIASGAFRYAGVRLVQEIQLPGSLERLEDRALMGLIVLGRIVIPHTVTHIGEDALQLGRFAYVQCNENSYAYQYCRKMHLDNSVDRSKGIFYHIGALPAPMTLIQRGEYNRLQWMFNQGMQFKPQSLEMLLLPAARGGFVPAQLEVGRSYALGRATAKNEHEAVRWYAIAARNGNVQAQFALGCCYESGMGIGKSQIMAGAWYTRAALMGHAGAIDSLKRLLSDSGQEESYLRELMDRTTR